MRDLLDKDTFSGLDTVIRTNRVNTADFMKLKFLIYMEAINNCVPKQEGVTSRIPRKGGIVCKEAPNCCRNRLSKKG